MSVPRTTTARYWQRHVERWRDGALSKSDYCREHGLAPSSFHRWVRRLADASSSSAAAFSTETSSPPLTLLPVQLRDDTSAGSSSVVARAGKIRISLPLSLDAAQARTWLAALAHSA